MNFEKKIERISNLFTSIDDEEKDNDILLMYLDEIEKNLNIFIKDTSSHLKKKHNIDYIISLFFNKNNIFYHHTSNAYFIYENSQYSIINENNLYHKILDFITKNSNGINIPTNLKYSLRSKIIKKIKEQNIYDNIIPDSITIQKILNFLYPTIFSNKIYAKYFILTIGDIITKKTDNLYFVSSEMKHFLTQLGKHISVLFFNINIFQYFKLKVCEQHCRQKCRLIQTNHINWNYLNISDDFYINLLFVSIHYTKRYESGETFVKTVSCNGIYNDVLFINNYDETEFITTFIKENISSNNESNISEKDMLYICKKYIESIHKPNLFKKNDDIIKSIQCHLEYENGQFKNVYSNNLPYVYKFKDFWKKYIYTDDKEHDFEITEILQLFLEKYNTKTNIDEKNIINIINHYYPSIYITNDSSIHNIGCILWNKKQEINQFFVQLKEEDEKEINVLYHKYCETFKIQKKVSKNYFIKYINMNNLLNDNNIPG